MLPLSLYIHFPWCLNKCPYCDFNSYKIAHDYSESVFLNKLSDDLKFEGEKRHGTMLRSIYFGGGTPGLLTPNAVASLILIAKNYFSFAENIEITLESNPGAVELSKYREFLAAGINRFSIGVQSFNDRLLMNIGRIHDASQARATVETLKSIGCNNINIDLMFGLPDQTVIDAIRDLGEALYYQLPHISWYQLTVEPETKFAIETPVLPNNENIWDMQLQGKNLLGGDRYHHYEVSAFCQHNYECRHNTNYWEFGDYIGVGPGAHSKVTDEDNVVHRWWKIEKPLEYINSRTGFIAEQKMVAKNEVPFEFMLNALRLFRPIPFSLFTSRTGMGIEVIAKQLHEAQQLGLIKLTSDEIITTSKGRNYLNNLLELFL